MQTIRLTNRIDADISPIVVRIEVTSDAGACCAIGIAFNQPGCIMRVFNGLSPVGVSDRSLVDAIDAVVPKLYNLPAPRSLCELNVDGEDYQWLLRWASFLTLQRTRRWLEGGFFRRITLQGRESDLTYAEAFGCMFLLLASEIARRHATEGGLWPTVCRRFPDSLASALFDFQSQPREILKSAMVASAKKLELRHVYGQQGTLEYYLSVYLQFGFTSNGVNRLPQWLAGQTMSESVQYLTGMHGDYHRSASFIELWDALKNLRRNNITEAYARWILEHSPWVSPMWADEIIEKANERLPYGSVDIDAPDDEQARSEFLLAPRLRWDGVSEPYFSSAAFNLLNIELTADQYVIRSDNRTLARLLASGHEFYRSDPEDIVIPPHSPNFTATIADERESTLASQFIDLWDPMEDVELFDLETGKCIPDPWGVGLTPRRDYGLLISADLDTEPNFGQFYLIGSGEASKKLLRIRVEENRPVRVILDGQDLWTSRIGGISLHNAVDPDWAKSVSVQLLPSNHVSLAELGMTSLSIYGMDDSVALNYVRVGSRPLDFAKDNGGYTTRQFNAIDFALQRSGAYELVVRLGLRMDNHRVGITRNLVLNASGVMRVSSDKREVIDPRDRLSIQDASRFVYKVIVPPRFIDQLSGLYVMEGTSVVGTFPIRPRPLNAVAGYGGRLWVSRDNQHQHVLTISEETHDPGVLAGVLSTRLGQSRLFLHQTLEPGQGHQVVFWKPGGPPEIQEARDVVRNPDGSQMQWDISFDYELWHDAFIGLAYYGDRIGAWWPSNLDAMESSGKDTALETFAMLRWMHAPILAQHWFRAVSELATKYADRAAQAWYQGGGLPEGLKQKPIDKEWIAAVRQLEERSSRSSY